MKSSRSSLFFRLRLMVLLSILFCVVVWAAQDVRSRYARKTWKRTLEIAVVLVQIAPLDPATAPALRARLPALEARLASEMHRYRPGGPKPFRFTLLGPVYGDAPPSASGEGVASLAHHAFDLWQYRRALDGPARVVRGAFDSRIYVAARPPVSAVRNSVEGESEENGRTGTVTVELDPSMTDLALAVVAHEVLHTLGASDKYDASGRALDRVGFAEPDRVPLYPQRFVEIMARGRPLSAGGEERLPESVDDVAVGPTTAAEIGWMP